MRFSSVLLVTSILCLAQIGVAELANGGDGELPSRATHTGTDQREVIWLRDGCESLLDEGLAPAGNNESIDYWGPVCHGYAIAARDYINLLTGSIQAQRDLLVEGCYVEGASITGRQVARVFIDYVDHHPASWDLPVASVMFDAVTQRWCPELQSQGGAQ